MRTKVRERTTLTSFARKGLYVSVLWLAGCGQDGPADAIPDASSSAHLDGGAALDSGTGTIKDPDGGSGLEGGTRDTGTEGGDNGGIDSGSIDSGIIDSGNGLSRVPPLGWSSWSFVRNDPTEAKIKAQADAMKSTGLAAHGFAYVNIDDFYMKCDGNGPVVDSHGRWVPDGARFPSGMKALGDYIHNLGLKLGVYVTPGIPRNAVLQNTPIAGTSYHASDIADTSRTENNYNCGNMVGIDTTKPGAQEYVDSFAQMFASWGADYLKIDGVGSWDIPDVQAWSSALKHSGRPIVLALSNSLAIDDAIQWRQLANSWRTQGDIECYCGTGPNGTGFPLTRWTNISYWRFDSAAAWQPYGAPGGWNDLDSLEVGNGDRVGLNPDQRRSQITLWAMAAAPMLLGSDLTDMDPSDVAMLTNDSVIAIDRDGVAATRIFAWGNGHVFSKREGSGEYVVALFNTGETDSLLVSAPWSMVGFPGGARVTDLWSGADLGTLATEYSVTLKPGESRLIRVNPTIHGAPNTTWTKHLLGQGSNRCVDDPGATTTDGTQVTLWDCHDAANQRWTYTEGRELQVIGKCLDVYSPNGPAAAGAKAQILSCHGGPSQQWNINANGTITSVPTGLCLDVSGAQTASNSGLIVSTCNGGSDESWTLTE